MPQGLHRDLRWKTARCDSFWTRDIHSPNARRVEIELVRHSEAQPGWPSYRGAQCPTGFIEAQQAGVLESMLK